MKKSTVIWLLSITVLIGFIGWEVVWAVNTVNRSAQKFRQDVLTEKELIIRPGGPELFLSPPIAKLKVGETQNIDVVLEPVGRPVVGFDLVLNFDPSVVTVVDAEATESGTQITSQLRSTTTVVNRVDNDVGKITFSALTSPTQTISTKSPIATLTLQGVSPGKTKLVFEHIPGITTDTNVTTASEGDVLDRTLGAEYVVERKTE